MLKRKCQIFMLVLNLLPFISYSQSDSVNESGFHSTVNSNSDVEFSSLNTTLFNDVVIIDGFSIESGSKLLNSTEESFPKNVFGIKMGADDPWIGITYERFLTQYIGTEVQIGLIGASLGAKFYFPAIRSGRMNFHVGVLPGWGFMGGQKIYIPIGINLITKSNIRISLDAGPRVWLGKDEEDFPGFSLRIGKAF
jgi:hypothetical protein